MTELPESYAENVSPRVLQLCLLRKAVCQLALLPRGRTSLLRGRLERTVHHQVRLLWLSNRGRGQMGWGSQQQLPLAVLQLYAVQEEPWGTELFRQGGQTLLQRPRHEDVTNHMARELDITQETVLVEKENTIWRICCCMIFLHILYACEYYCCRIVLTKYCVLSLKPSKTETLDQKYWSPACGVKNEKKLGMIWNMNKRKYLLRYLLSSCNACKVHTYICIVVVGI